MDETFFIQAPFEAMCLDGFEADNIRGIQDLADRLTTKLSVGGHPRQAVADVFTDRFGQGPVARRYSGDPLPPQGATGTSRGAGNLRPELGGNSYYESHRKEIVAAFKRCKNNIFATERLLRSQGLRCSRRWLGVFAKRWGIRS